MARILRLYSLYNYEPRKDAKPRAKKRKPRVGLLGIGKSKLYEDYLLQDPSDPFIPGTDVPRLSLVYLGPNTPAVTDDEVNRVIADLQRWASRSRTKATTVPASLPRKGRRRNRQKAGTPTWFSQPRGHRRS
jgi:hypothetical protein